MYICEMEIIIMNRGHGKTYQLIKKSASSGDYIVCHNQNECSRIAAEAQEMKMKIPFPITYQEFMDKHYYGKWISGFLIDNIEMFLQTLTEVPINVITLNY